MTLTRRTPTGRELRLVTDEPTALEVEVARIRAERIEKMHRTRQICAAEVYTTTRSNRSWFVRMLRRWRRCTK